MNDDQIVWKEAKNNQGFSDDDDDDEHEGNNVDVENKSINDWDDDDDDQEASDNSSSIPNDDRSLRISQSSPIDQTADQLNTDEIVAHGPIGAGTSIFSAKQLDLKLKRNIVDLSQLTQTDTRSDHSTNDGLESFGSWLEKAHVAVSPNADCILFASQNPKKMIFYAKLRMEPIDQYTIKTLDVPLDFDEYISSLLCLPIMSSQKTSLGSVDWTAFVVGLSSGYLKFYTEQSICLLSLKFCDEPIVSVKCQTQKSSTNARSQTHFASIVDELLIVYKSCAVVLDGIGLYENLRISKEEVAKSRSTYEPAYTVANLPTIITCSKFGFKHNPNESRVLDAELLGMRYNTRFDALKSDSIDSDHVQAKACSRTLALVGQNPFLAFYCEGKETITHSYTELITSLLPVWNKPQPTRVQINTINRIEQKFFFDKGRLATSIVVSPDKRLAAVTDDFGRVLLIDNTNCLAVRMWKGYRSAQCGWIEVKRDPDDKCSPVALYLVVYAPRRGLLEIWSAQRGPRVAAFNVGRNCRILYAGHKMLNMRAELAARGVRQHNSLIEQSYSTHCYLLHARSGTVFTIELPYTYSLYKFGDLRSRDHLLIGELTSAIEQDAEPRVLFEILHRIALNESLEIVVHKIAINLQPSEVCVVLESLVNKIMKNYDNDSGETMTDEDASMVNLCKRIILLSAIYSELFKSSPKDITLPEVNQRLIDQFEEHPQEIDELANQLGWTQAEILRYLSLLALRRSYQGSAQRQDVWPSMGEPLIWSDFISCFDLTQNHKRNSRRSIGESEIGKQDGSDSAKVSIRLKEFDSKFLNQDKVIKTALFIHNRCGEYHRFASSAKAQRNSGGATILTSKLNVFASLEPASRLVLLFQFWLSTRLCNHWKLWPFLQEQIGAISDELKVASMRLNSDDLLISTWKKVYELILESDNLFGAMIATAAIRSDTLRTIRDNEKREKLDRQREKNTNEDEADPDGTKSTIDWECLCIDAERMSLLVQQLEDLFLLKLILEYSPLEGHLIENRYVYRVPRISVANILRGGPTIVSELVSQWAVQSDIDLNLFIQVYGAETEVDQPVIVTASDSPSSSTPSVDIHSARRPQHWVSRARGAVSNNADQIIELIHHSRVSFPRSLDANIILLNCIWEFCRRWSNSVDTDKNRTLKRAFDTLMLLQNTSLKHNLASVLFKSFFQRVFERLTVLVETNPNLLSVKSSRICDALTRKELNMGDDSLEGFVEFCCNLSEFLLETKVANIGCVKQDPEATYSTRQTSSVGGGSVNSRTPDAQGNREEQNLDQLMERLLIQDDWWTIPTSSIQKIVWQAKHADLSSSSFGESVTFEQQNTLVETSLSKTNQYDIDTLVELNKLTNLMKLVIQLRIPKALPLTLIGEESRQLLRFDLQHSPTMGADMKSRLSSLAELRQRFARKCILGIVSRLTDQTNEITEEEYEVRLSLDDIDSCDWRPTASDNNCQKSRVVSGKPIDDPDRTQTSTNKTSRNNDGHDCDTGRRRDDSDDHGRDEGEQNQRNNTNSQSMLLFTTLIALATDWQLDCDELNLEFVFELFRCNLDKIATQVASRIQDKQTLANGLLKIASQRVLVLFGLSSQVSDKNQWKLRIDKWSLFQPNVSSWLKSIQQEEIKHELAHLSFSESLRPQLSAPDAIEADLNSDSGGNDDLTDDPIGALEQSLGVQLFALNGLRQRTKLVLEEATNYLEGASARLAYDLLQLLVAPTFDRFLQQELRALTRGTRAGDCPAT